MLHITGGATRIAGIGTANALEDIYTVSGVKVNKANRPGVYIRDGRKIIVK